METQTQVIVNDLEMWKKLLISAKAMETYGKDFRLSNVTIFPKSTHSVIKLTDDIVCKIRPCNEREKTSSLRDALVTKFLIKNNAPVVPFCEKFPIFPLLVDKYLITFRKYVEQQKNTNISNESCIKGTGKALATCHILLRTFDLEDWKYSEIGWEDDCIKTETLVPNVYNNLVFPRKIELSRAALFYCSKCIEVLQKLQLLVSSNLDKLDPQKGQLLHGDFHVLNKIKTETQILINDWEAVSFGPVEYDCGSFLASLLNGKKDLLSSDRRVTEFLAEYKDNGGMYEEDLINFMFEIQTIKHALQGCPLQCIEKSSSRQEDVDLSWYRG